MLRPLMHYLERKLHARDMDSRVSHPFEWGLEFLGADDQSIHHPDGYSGHNSESPRHFITRFNAEALAQSDRFFTPPPTRASDFEISAPESGFHWLSFPSAINTPYEKNNRVHARM